MNIIRKIKDAIHWRRVDHALVKAERARERHIEAVNKVGQLEPMFKRDQVRAR